MTAAVLVFVMPVYVLMAVAAAFSRAAPPDGFDWALGVVAVLVSVVAYVLVRSRDYRRGVWLVAGAAVVLACVAGARERDTTRAIATTLIGLIGVMHAGFVLSRRGTVVVGGAYLVLMALVWFTHPSLRPADMLVPGFLALYVVALTVLGAHLRRKHVEDLKRTAHVMAMKEARVRATLDSALDAVVVVDDVGTVVEWGSVAEATFGPASREAVGAPFVSVVSTQDPSPLFDALKPPTFARLDVMARHRLGHTFPCEVVVAPLRTGGAAVFLRDVSRQRKLEARLMLTDRLETMGRMVAGVAHEVNNPLAFVLANLSHLEGELSRPAQALDPSELKGVVSEALEGARRIQGIIRNLRSFSRSGEHEALGPVDVERVLDSSLQVLQPQVRQAGATITKRYQGVGVVQAFEGRLGQVFVNLLVNAVQALPGELNRREITVVTERRDDEVRILIQDSGRGIDQATLGRLFEPFFTTKPPGVGTGLGLSISQNIVTTLGGEITVETEVGVGTTFTVVLPVNPPTLMK